MVGPWVKVAWFNHRHQLHGLLSPRTATLELTAYIVCSECFRFRYVTNVNHCMVPKALIVLRSKSMRSRPDNGKNHRHQLHGLLSPRTATLELTADIVCSECFRFRYVTNVNHCIVPKALIVPMSKSMRSRPDNGRTQFTIGDAPGSPGRFSTYSI